MHNGKKQSHSGAGNVSVVGNGRRVQRVGKTLEIQDVWTGDLAMLAVRPGRGDDGGVVDMVYGGVRAIERSPWMAALPGIGAVHDGKGRVSVAVLTAFLTTGERAMPPFPVPTIADLRRAADGCRPTDEQLQTVSHVVSVLASRPAGAVTAESLWRHLRRRFPRPDIGRMVEAAVRLGKVRWRYKSGERWYWMPANWDWAAKALPSNPAAPVAKAADGWSLFDDLDQRRVLFVTEGKGAATVGRFVRDFKRRGGDPKQIEQVCMDMSPAFISGVEAKLPHAAVTFDRYHVMALVNDAVDEVRRRETESEPVLKKSRYLWLKNPQNLKAKDAQRLEALTQLHLKTARAYQMKLTLQGLWEYRHAYYAEQYLKKWYWWATHCRLEPMKAVAATIRRHWEGILHFIRSRITNGILEGLNAKVKAAAKRAFGFKTFEYYRTIIYLIAGRLELPVPA
jgi:hypothetical protein